MYKVNGYFLCKLYVYGYVRIVYNIFEVICMAVSDAHKKASAKWNASRDNIMIRPTKDEGAKIRAVAAAAGQSVQAFILEAVREKIRKNG